jgi:hypothetical protein
MTPLRNYLVNPFSSPQHYHPFVYLVYSILFTYKLF